MQILRVSPYPLVASWDVPLANTGYVLELEDNVDQSKMTIAVTSSAGSKVTYTMQQSDIELDREFSVRIYDASGQTVLADVLSVYRPYVDPNTLAETATDIHEYTTLEIVARSIIDEFIEDGFYNKKEVIQSVGNGTDYFPVWNQINRVLKVYENNVLVYDGEDQDLEVSGFYDVNQSITDNVALTTSDINNYFVGNLVTLSGFDTTNYDDLNATFRVTEIIDEYSFRINKTIDDYSLAGMGSIGSSQRIWQENYAVTMDNSAIYKTYADRINRYEAAPISLPAGTGDIWTGVYSTKAFQKTIDYIFVVDAGPKEIAPDIAYAAKLLIEDIKCGKLEYYQRYVSSYNTDQFKIQFDSRIMDGTGNMLADKILAKHYKSIKKLGVL
jgi:hypothetical protein